MKYFRLDPTIINFIAEIYSNDETKMKIRKDTEIDFKITSGIRQGCNLSATLFKMIVYRIMMEVEDKCEGFEMRDMKINTLFYADDGMILSEGLQATRKSIKILKKESLKFGLEINQSKSKILIFNSKEEITEIENIEVVEELVYLGVKIESKRNMFNKYKNEMMTKARKMENMTYSMIDKSVNRLLIGKAYWKAVALPTVLHGMNAININKGEINKLQIIENNVYRKILKAPSYTPIVALRGEIGSSCMLERVIRGKILYWKYIKEGENELLKEIMRSEKASFNKTVNKYLEIVQLKKKDILINNKEWIKKELKKWDEREWRNELERKSTLKIYAENKKSIKENIYFNNNESLLMFRIKTNTLPLNDRKRHTAEDTSCKLCNYECEDVQHFMIDCNSLQECRKNIFELQRPVNENKDKVLGELLFGYGIKNEIGIYNMWKLRNKMLEESNKENN